MTEDHERWDGLSNKLFELVCCGVEQPHRCMKPSGEFRDVRVLGMQMVSINFEILAFATQVKIRLQNVCEVER